MKKLISLDVADIARKFSNSDVTHVKSGYVSKDTKAHAYVLGADVKLPADKADDPNIADVIVHVDGGGAYEVFMQEGVKGQGLLNTCPAASGHVSEFMADPDETRPSA